MSSFYKEMGLRMPLELTFGFYFENHHIMNDEKVRSLGIVHNVVNGMDWFPATGVISGIARGIFLIILVSNAKQQGLKEKGFKCWLIAEGVRAVVSSLGLGFLFLVPDLLFAYQEKNRQEIMILLRNIQ